MSTVGQGCHRVPDGGWGWCRPPGKAWGMGHPLRALAACTWTPGKSCGAMSDPWWSQTELQAGAAAAGHPGL